MIRRLRQLFCKHEFKLFGQIVFSNWVIQHYRCPKCGKMIQYDWEPSVDHSKDERG